MPADSPTHPTLDSPAADRPHAGRAALLALFLSCLFAAAARAEPPHPILLVHGITSSHEMWGDPATRGAADVQDRDPIAEIANRYGIQDQQIAPAPLHVTLNLDGNPAVNNLDVANLSAGIPPSTTADIGTDFPQIAGDYLLWRVNFRLGGDGIDSAANSEARPLSASPELYFGPPRTAFRLAAGADRDDLHVGQYLRGGCVACPGFSYFRIIGFDEDPTYNVTLAIEPGQPDPGLDPSGWGFSLVNLSNEEAIVKQAVGLREAIEHIRASTTADRVILITHSMGGLAARGYLQWDQDGDGVGDLWAVPAAGGHKVAKLVTLGTPHGGSNAAADVLLSITIDQRSNASRDLSYDYDGGSDPPSTQPGNPGVFLLGGDEADVPTPGDFYSADVNANGSEDAALRGIDQATDAQLQNPLMPLPDDVDYFWVVGSWFEIPAESDGAVRVDRQLLYFVGEAKKIHACHALPWLCCTEPRSYDALIEAADEPDRPASAWTLRPGRPVTAFITHQGDVTPDPTLDFDLFRFSVSGTGSFTISLSDTPGAPVGNLQLRLLDAAGSPIGLPDTSPPFSITHSIAATGPTDFFAEVSGTAPASDPGFGFGDPFDPLRNACDPDDTDCPNCRDPYVLELTSELGQSSVDLSAAPSTAALGSATALTARVSDPSGGGVLAGVEVTFEADHPGSFGGCSSGASPCRAPTDGSGIARVTFSSAVEGSARITAGAETGGSDTATVTFGNGGIVASASPNPVVIGDPSTISVSLTTPGGAPAGSGVPVTFSTSHPGLFSGNGAGSASPQTLLTDAAGATWIRFTGTASGTASITIEAPDADPVVLPLAVETPSGNIAVALAVAFQNGTASYSDYELEVLVTDASGEPIVGENVTFTKSRGTFTSFDDCSTGPTGVCDVGLRVASSGDVTVTAEARGVVTATTFFAQVGTPSCAQIYPVRTLTSGTESYGVAYTPDGSVLIASEENRRLLAWNTSDWSPRWNVEVDDDRVGQVSVSPNGTRVLVTHDDGTDIFHVSNGARECTAPLGGYPTGEEAINGVFISDNAHFHTSDGNGTATPGSDPGIFLHSSRCGTGVKKLTLTDGDDFQEQGHMDYSSAKNWIAVGSHEGKLYVRNASGGAVTTQNVTAGNDDGFDVDFNASGSRLLAVGWRVIKSFNTSNWSFTSYSATTVGDWIYSVKFIDNDSKIAVGGRGTLEILNASGGSCFRKAVTTGYAVEMDWSPSRQELAVATQSGKVHVFKPLDPPDGQPPIVSVFEPVDGFATPAGEVTTRGRVTDNSSVASFTVNGVEVPLDASDEFSHAVPLAAGSNTISFSATDPSGNTATTTRSVTRLVDSTPPVIDAVSVTPPLAAPGQLFEIAATIVDGDTGVASASATVRDAAGGVVAVIPLAAAMDSRFRGEWDSTSQPLGLYSVDLQAVDSSPQANVRERPGAAGIALRNRVGLALSKSDGQLVQNIGASLEYTIEVSNDGPDPALGAVVVDDFPEQLACSWECSGVNGGSCSPGPSSDPIDDSVDLPAGGMARYRVSCVAAAGVSGNVTNSASVSVPANHVDADPSDNLDDDTNVLALAGPCGRPTSVVLRDMEVDTTEAVEACSSIRAGSGFHLGWPGDLTLLAGDLIVLENGFSTGAGARLHAEVGPLEGISVFPLAADFGVVDVGASQERTFTVTNIGTAPVAGEATVAPPFSVLSGSPYALAGGDSAEVVVEFSPTAAETFNDQVSFTGGQGALRAVSGSGRVAGPQTLLEENFDAGLPPEFVRLAGTVSATAGVLGLSSGGCVQLPGDYSRSQGLRIQLDVNVTNGANGDFNFYPFFDSITNCGAGPANDGYYIGLYPSSGDNTENKLYSKIAGVNTELDGSPSSLNANSWHTVVIRLLADGQITVAVDGALRLSATNSDHQSGPFAIRGWGTVYLDNLSVSTAPP